MESKIATANDVLLKALSMDLPDSAEYVLSKEQVTYYPQGSQTYSPEAGRLVRFTLGDNSGAMLDPTSVRLSYLLRNKTDGIANIADKFVNFIGMLDDPAKLKAAIGNLLGVDTIAEALAFDNDTIGFLAGKLSDFIKSAIDAIDWTAAGAAVRQGFINLFQGAGDAAWNSAQCAPEGSWMTANSPIGVSRTSPSSLPPSDFEVSRLARRSATVM